jgi:hypothetical protein
MAIIGIHATWHEEGKFSVPVYWTLPGRVKQINLVPRNNCCQFCCNVESGSIEIKESDLQWKKRPDPRISTVRGIAINFRENLPNVLGSIHFNIESDLNEIDESWRQERTQSEAKVSMPCVIMIDMRENEENTANSIGLSFQSSSNEIN